MRGIFGFGREKGSGNSIEMNDELGVVELLEARVMLSGEHFIVNSLADTMGGDNEITLRGAIQAANLNNNSPQTEPDLITFDESLAGGMIVLSIEQLVIHSDIAIRGIGADQLTISGDRFSSVFIVASGFDVSIESLTITGGGNGLGGGIYNAGNLTLTDVTVTDNSGTRGGGIYNGIGCKLEVNNSRVIDNIAGEGGGIFNDQGEVQVHDSVISGNIAISNYGGGIASKDGVLHVADSVISGNRAEHSGGGVRASGTFTLTGSTVSGNISVDGNGGGISSSSDTTFIRSTNVLNNTAGFYGGGIAHFQGVVSIEDCLIQENESGGAYYGKGGGIYNYQGSMSLTNIQVKDNQAVGEIGGGGGIYNKEGDLNATDSIISGNKAVYGGGINNIIDGSVTLINATVSGNYADISGGGIITSSGELAVINSEISGNLASDGYGGGIWNGGILTVTDSLVSGNTVDGIGGGIYSVDSDVVVRSSRIVTNTAIDPYGGKGGGIYQSAGRLELVDSEVSGNTASSYSGYAFTRGGGIMSIDGMLVAVNTNIVGNSSMVGGGIYHTGNYENEGVLLVNTLVLGNRGRIEGGGIYNSIGLLTIVNSAVICNSGQFGSGIYGDGSRPVTLNNTIVALNDRYDIEILYNGTGGANNLIGIDPLFALNPDDGGDGWGDDPTTLDEDESLNDDYGDLRLAADSPAVNGGDNGLLPVDEFDLDGDGDVTEVLPVDLDGNARVIGGRIDIGAYESGYLLPQLNADFNADMRVGLMDMDILGRNYGMESGASKADGDANGDGKVGLLDLDILGRTWGMGAMGIAGSGSQGILHDQGRTYDVDWWEIELEEDEVVLF